MAKKITSSLGGTPTNALPESPMLRKAREADRDPSGLTVGGIPIEDIPGGHMIGFGNTDQGIAEREAKPHAYTTAGASEFDKSIQQRRDFRNDESNEQWHAPDPMKDLADKYVRPGFSGKFMSRSVSAHKGLEGFVPIKDNGKEITLGTMFLAEAPIGFVKRRNKKYQDEGKQAMAEVANRSSEELVRSARDSGMSPRAAAAQAEEGLHESRGNSAVLK